MIDDSTFTWALGFFAGATTGFWFGVRWRRPPYSSAAIVFRATAEDAAKVRSKIVNPLAWEDPPEQFIRMDEGHIQRGNQRNGGPTTPKPKIVPRGTGSGYQPRPSGSGTPNPPPSDP